ncbi:unnamed protein product [Polarella glacialis]|uniref:Uncharacterized protein n=1 Tax=Polarella glacialis TaxID=89957 RepID=A0A813DYS8_POLGL|nr:unnamed protein product [Polarella glacialis]
MCTHTHRVTAVIHSSVLSPSTAEPGVGVEMLRDALCHPRFPRLLLSRASLLLLAGAFAKALSRWLRTDARSKLAYLLKPQEAAPQRVPEAPPVELQAAPEETDGDATDHLPANNNDKNNNNNSNNNNSSNNNSKNNNNNSNSNNNNNTPALLGITHRVCSSYLVAVSVIFNFIVVVFAVICCCFVLFIFIWSPKCIQGCGSDSAVMDRAFVELGHIYCHLVAVSVICDLFVACVEGICLLFCLVTFYFQS